MNEMRKLMESVNEAYGDYSSHTERQPREATTAIAELMDEGILEARVVANACLNYMSETEVSDMADDNNFFGENYDNGLEEESVEYIGENYDVGDTIEELLHIKEQIKELVGQAESLISDFSGARDRATSYWIPHILGALDSDHGYMGGSMTTMQDTIEEIESDSYDDEGEDDDDHDEYRPDTDEDRERQTADNRPR